MSVPLSGSEGQVPVGTEGQVPTNTTEAIKPAGTETTQSTEPQTFDAAYVEKLRTEAATWRTKVRTVEQERDTYKTKVDEVEAANLSELEKAQRDVLNFQTTVVPTYQNQVRTLQMQVAASQAGVVDPDAASKLVDWARVDAGESLDVVLTDLLTAKPWLKATVAPAATATDATQTPTQPVVPPVVPNTTSAGAPVGNTQQPKVWTKAMLQQMTANEIEANWESISVAMSKGPLPAS